MSLPRIGLGGPTALAFLVLVGACKRAPSTSAQSGAAPAEVSKDSALLFTYVEPEGIFATTDQADKVPEVARRLVRIMGQDNRGPRRKNDTEVEVVDLGELLAKGKTQPRVMSHAEFETGALALLPPGDSCLLAQPHGAPLAGELDSPEPLDGPPVAILYGTRWCQACFAARQYLVDNRIPFLGKDIEKDPAAARELREKAALLRVAANRVPTLDVLGRLLVGYDEGRMKGQLADW